MIAPVKVEQIKQLLAEGILSLRQIVEKTGISRGTVAAISNGRRPDYEKLRAARYGELHASDPLVPLSPPARCPTCGGMVYLPCRLCELRTKVARGGEPDRRREPECIEPLELILKEEHRQRYEEVHARRVQAERLAMAGADEDCNALRGPLP